MLFLILLCTLVVPRAAWSAHEAGHEELSSAIVVHTHHGDHVHEREDADTGVDEAGEDAGDNAGGLTHEHSPSIALGAALILPDEIALSTIIPVRSSHDFARYGGVPLLRPESLLRPPRTA